MSYAEAKELYKKKHNKALKNSWVAHVLSDHGKTSGPAHSRKGDYKYPCPPSERTKVEKILKELSMI